MRRTRGGASLFGFGCSSRASPGRDEPLARPGTGFRAGVRLTRFKFPELRKLLECLSRAALPTYFTGSKAFFWRYICGVSPVRRASHLVKCDGCLNPS